MAQGTGGGVTIAFSTSGFAADILTLSHSGLSIPAVESSHLGTSTDATFMRGDLIDWGSLNIGYAVDTSNTATKIPPVSEDNTQTITITFPGTSKVITGTVIVTDADLFNFAINERIEGSFDCKISGALAFSTT